MTEIAAPFPPASLMFMQETPEQMLVNGRSLMDFVRQQGFFADQGSVLDMGCGYGRIAYYLMSQGFSGSYLGYDILRPQVEWLQANLSPHAKGRMEFRHLDVENDRYNPGGRLRATEMQLRDVEPAPDLILAFSVFTHMYPPDIIHYLRQLATLMKPGSVLCATFFLLNDSSLRCDAEGLSAHPMPYQPSQDCRYQSASDPLHAIGYTNRWVERALERAGLELADEIHLGSWCGRGQQATYQDTLFVRPKSA